MLIQFAFAAHSLPPLITKLNFATCSQLIRFIRHLSCPFSYPQQWPIKSSINHLRYFMFWAIQSENAVTRVKTSGAPLAQGTPHETTPHTWPDDLSTNGPPESPLHAPSSLPFNVQMFLLKLTGGVSSRKCLKIHSGLEMAFKSARFSSRETFPGY